MVEAQTQNYVGRLQACYKMLSRSRVVHKRETDGEALEYFQRFCNEALPKDESETLLRVVINNLYHNDKTSFNRCISKDQYLVLLTDARSIVVHFGVQNLIYIKWDGSQYSVQKNDVPVTPEKFNRNNRGGRTRKPSYQELLEMVQKMSTRSEKNSDHKNDSNDQPEPIELDLDQKTENRPRKSWADEE